MKTKTLGKLKKDVQEVVNAYIRKRDEGKPCISCDKLKPLQAGHYYPTSIYDSLRFNEMNIHGECVGCNCHDQNHLDKYTENIVDRIGLENLNQLIYLAAMYKKNGYKFTRDELNDIKKKYQAKIKEL